MPTAYTTDTMLISAEGAGIETPLPLLPLVIPFKIDAA